jgi:hypothetical protein
MTLDANGGSPRRFLVGVRTGAAPDTVDLRDLAERLRQDPAIGPDGVRLLDRGVHPTLVVKMPPQQAAALQERFPDLIVEEDRPLLPS